MTGTQRNVSIAALILLCIGVGLGFVHAWQVNHSTLLVLREQYKEGWLARTTQSTATADDLLRAAKQMNYRYLRIVDAHAHIIKLATVLLLVALIQPLVRLSEARKRALAATFVVGSCIFPIGVLAEISVKGWPPQAVAAFGAVLVMLSFAGLLYGLLLGTHSSSSHRV